MTNIAQQVNKLARTLNQSDARVIDGAEQVLDGKSRRSVISRAAPFLGPAFVASVAYVDPGNFATNIQGGAKYGYTLLWVVVISNVMAMLIQALSAKLGIATGRNLAEVCRRHFPRPLVWLMWIVAELIAMVTDMAEFLGAALGFYLLFGIPLWAGATLTAIFTILILGLERYGFRPLEAAISAFVGIIALCYLVETFLEKPNWASIFKNAFTPQFVDHESILLAAGILGATVMPHVIFLHSALTQGRIKTKDPRKLSRLYHYQLVDVVIALGIAGLVNAAMLIMAASTFHRAGLVHVATIEEAHLTLEPLLGKASSWVFAISLLASGLSSSAVGTMSGQIVMKGFIRRRIPLLLRRLITMSPALIAIVVGADPTRTLVISQVVLSFGIPFALVPLIMFTANKRLMGSLVNHWSTTFISTLVATLIIGLNGFLLYSTLSEFFR